jgi:hypothetical protein
MEDVQPIGNAAWVRVENEYNRLNPTRTRNIDGLRRKYNWVKDSKIPTGDPNCPEHIRTAKRAHWKIVGKAEITTAMSDEDDEELGPALEEDDGMQKPSAKPSAGDSDDAGSSPQEQKKRKAKKSPAFANRKKGSASTKASSDIMEIFMIQRSEAQERRERLEAQQMQNNQLMMQMFSSAVAAFASALSPTTPTPGVPVAAAAFPPSRP